jgi:hypothetical protein
LSCGIPVSALINTCPIISGVARLSFFGGGGISRIFGVKSCRICEDYKVHFLKNTEFSQTFLLAGIK